MIDRLKLRCDFKIDPLDFNIANLDIPLIGDIDEQGRLTNLFHKWDSIPSHHAGIGFKIFDYSTDPKNPRCYIELNASPAKVMQGHNIFGTDNLQRCALALMEPFFMQFPNIADLLDASTWEVCELDITYHSRAESVLHAIQFINALSNVSKGQTKARTGYASTAYFGKKNSRLKKIKIYEKYTEVQQYLKKLLKKKDGELLAAPFTEKLIEYSKGLVRWEVTLKKRWFERREIPTNLFELQKVFNAIDYWKEATRDIFKAIEGERVMLNTDEKVHEALKEKYYYISAKGNKIYTRANNAFKTYKMIKSMGYSGALALSTQSSFYKDIQCLHEVGMSRAHLQNLDSQGSTVIPMVRYTAVEFEQQIPSWAKVA